MKKCAFCFMREGDRCYAEPMEREPDGSGRSKKIIKIGGDCDVPEQFMAKAKLYQFLADCVPDNNIKS